MTEELKFRTPQEGDRKASNAEVPHPQSPVPGRHSGPGTRDQGRGTRDQGPGTGDQGPGTARKHRVLFVDDEPPVLTAIRRVLRREPYELLTTERPAEALDWVERGDISLVISDHRMAGVSGVELLEEVRKRAPHTARALLTGYPGPSLIAKSKEEGILELLRKPWDDVDLKESIRRILAECESRSAAADEESRCMELTLESGKAPVVGAVGPYPKNGESDHTLARRHVVVCIDDDPRVLAALRRTFRREPFLLLTTSNPREALRWLQEGDVSLVITDYRMPEMTGTQLLEETCRHSPSTARLVLTAFPNRSLVADGSTLGAEWLITKPWDDGEIRLLIRQILWEREQREPPGAAEETSIRFRGQSWQRSWTVPALDEIVLRVQCKDRTSPEILERLAPKFRRAAASRRSLVVVLDDLGGLKEETGSLLHGMALRVCAASAPVSVLDMSGAASSLSAEFRCTLPYALYSGKPGTCPRARVLLVENQDDDREFLRIAIESLNYACDAVPTAEEGKARLEQSSCDTVLLDLDLPGGSGLEFGKYLAEQKQEIRVVPISGRFELWNAEGLAQLGLCDGRLAKPYRLYEVVKRLAHSWKAGEIAARSVAVEGR